MNLQFLTAPLPIHPGDPGPPPGSILLDVSGYINDCTNATTAESFTKAGKRIKVTFWAARPPRGSCFTVHSPDLDPSEFGAGPKILTTEGDLVLLRVPSCPPCCARTHDYFVYQAGSAAESKRPSLDLIPTPPPDHFSDYQAGLLRCRDRDMYFVALLCWAPGEGQYDFHLYNSETGMWSNKLMHLDSRQKKLLHVYSSKVITIGGELGSIGWVDLSWGILICDVLLDSSELRYIPLPPPAVPKPFGGAPSFLRDAIVLEGYIRYFEMCVYKAGGKGDRGWEALTWRRKDSWNKWEEDFVIDVSEDSVQEADEQPTLKGSYAGYPVLSSHDAGVVYIIDRQSCPGENAPVIAVDMRKQTLKGVADYCSGRILGYSFAFCASGISKHLRTM
ncbi:unnamed protein product [Urochloa decumbens]|uniref:DUF1618 domain-containing protein n=1 Tax=Urochloa decumbens TaxID=240449 RepID=A0ABC9FWE0_9POAL